ncbi:MAG: DNA alkylation repair protein [Clostridia bacterium]|nr:DNA alkylation repair protein [Clostridia bacterium]
MSWIRAELFAAQDLSYRNFQGPLLPTVDQARMIGVRVPVLRKLATAWKGTPEAEAFLRTVPHDYYEEDMLHALLLNTILDYDRCVAGIQQFLPYVDNWTVCDSLRPKCFAPNRDKLLKEIPAWLASAHPYAVRFGLEMLMVHFLEDAFRPEFLEWAAAVRSEAYYVRMMQAWFFAEALSKQYETAVVYMQERRLDPWVHRKTIQKAVESHKVSEERKQELKSLRGNEK